MFCKADGKWWLTHDWGEWKSKREPLVINELGLKRHVGFFVEQHRKCTRCSKVETETSRHNI